MRERERFTPQYNQPVEGRDMYPICFQSPIDQKNLNHFSANKKTIKKYRKDNRFKGEQTTRPLSHTVQI